MTLYDLRVENQTTPLGLGEFSPRFSWKVRESQNGFIQKSYRIQVSLDDSFVSPVWDSGDVATSESHLVPYAGPALAPRTRYLFRVMGSGVSGETSGWSETSWFETAFEPGVWSARFISPEGADNGSSSRPKAIRKTFTLPFVPTSARAYATALGLYELCVNGKKAGDAVLTPGWTVYQKRVAYQTYDVTNLLVEGANTVSALVAPGWYKGEITWFKKRNLYGNRLAFSAFIEAKGSSGESLVLSSDESWEAADTALLYAEIYHGETYDARLEGTERWTRAEPVPTPKIDIVAQDGPPVVKNETFRAKRISTPAGGEILDFGQNLTGWVKFAVKGKKGQRIVISHAETLDAAGNFYTANMRGARNRIEYILKGKVEESFEPRFSFQGFRYIRVEGWRGKIDPDAFTATAIHSRMRQTLDFECSHSGLNQLHHNILWGWKGNAVDIPTDCPQRDERLGWTGDAQVFVPTAARLCQVDHFFRKWLRDLRADQLPDGAVPHVIPDVLRILNMPDPIQKQYEASTGWADASVIVPWEVYVASGDVRLLEESWPSMKAWVDYIRVHARNGVLWDSGFHFGDWVALDAKEGSYFGATPNDLTATAYYAYSAGIVSRVAGILGKDDAREEYSALHDSIVDAFQKEFITPRGRIAARTQTAQILSLVFGLVSGEHRARVSDDLAALINENGGHLTTGFLGTPRICEALSETGKIEAAYDLLLKEDFPSWLYQISRGATTVWEHWDGLKPDGTMWSTNMNSFNHYAYGAVGDWMYSVIGGISPDPDAPGYRHIVFKPRPGGGITRARERIETPYGPVSMEWAIEGKTMNLNFSVPPNADATLFAPDGSESREYGSGSWSATFES